MIATSTGVAPTSIAAWLTLVRAMPAFCTMTDPPYPTAPQASTAGVQARRSLARTPHASRMAAARPKRAKVSQAGASHSSASLDAGTVVPHSRPAAVRAAKAGRRLVFIKPSCGRLGTKFAAQALMQTNISLYGH
jgi:hypothetical protein